MTIVGFVAFVYADDLVGNPSVLLEGGISVMAIVSAYAIFWVLMRRLRVRYWKAAAADTSLTPTDEGYLAIPLLPSAFDRYVTTGRHHGDGRFVLPCYEGSVEGRAVRASTGRRKCTKGTTTTWQVYTVVETELERDAHEHDGAIVVTDTDRERGDGTRSTMPLPITQFADAETDELTAAATSDHLAQALVSGTAQDALRTLKYVVFVFAGDASEVYDAVPEDDWGDPTTTIETVLDAHDEDGQDPAWIGGTQTVSIVTEGTIAETAQLEAMCEAAVTIADTFKEERTW